MANWISLADILNKDSAAIMALATATSALATVVLIFWTIKYVRLTRSLVASSYEQFQHHVLEQKQQLEAEKHGLHELIKIFLIILNGLPTTRDRAAEMIHVTLWTDEDLIDMRRLSSGLGGNAIGNVFWSIYHLNVIHEQVRKAQEDLKNGGTPEWEFRWEDFAGVVTQAKQELGHLLELL